MTIEIGGIKVHDEAEAKTYEAQGFIDPDKLNEALQKLKPEQKLDLNRLAIMHDRNRGIPLWKVILRELGLAKRE